jgi:hypothetical protein
LRRFEDRECTAVAARAETTSPLRLGNISRCAAPGEIFVVPGRFPAENSSLRRIFRSRFLSYHLSIARRNFGGMGRGAPEKGRRERRKRRLEACRGGHAGRLLPVRRFVVKYMKIVVQNRKTNAFLTQDAKWVRRLDDARHFTTSIEALRFCADRELRDMDMLVCFPGAKANLRLPLI